MIIELLLGSCMFQWRLVQFKRLRTFIPPRQKPTNNLNTAPFTRRILPSHFLALRPLRVSMIQKLPPSVVVELQFFCAVVDWCYHLSLTNCLLFRRLETGRHKSFQLGCCRKDPGRMVGTGSGFCFCFYGTASKRRKKTNESSSALETPHTTDQCDQCTPSFR